MNRTTWLANVIALAALSGRALAYESSCVQSVPIVAGDDPVEIERQCAMNRKILDNCATLTGANLMNEAFAQNIKQQMVQAECDKQLAEWQSENSECTKAYQDFERKMQVYEAEAAQYQKDAQAYTAATGQPPPVPAGGLSFSVSWCAGDCPKVPVQPTVPTGPSCAVASQPVCDTAAIEKRIYRQVEAKARESLAQSMEVRRHALDYDCRAAKLIADDARKRREADEALRATIERREQGMQTETKAFEADRDARNRIAQIAGKSNAHAAAVERSLGPLAPPATPVVAGSDLQAKRPMRIRYGVKKGPGGDAAAREQRCRDQADVLVELKTTEAQLERLVERLRLKNATSQWNDAVKKLDEVRAARERLEAASSDCRPL